MFSSVYKGNNKITELRTIFQFLFDIFVETRSAVVAFGIPSVETRGDSVSFGYLRYTSKLNK
jgi:hypothetical protein